MFYIHAVLPTCFQTPNPSSPAALSVMFSAGLHSCWVCLWGTLLISGVLGITVSKWERCDATRVCEQGSQCSAAPGDLQLCLPPLDPAMWPGNFTPTAAPENFVSRQGFQLFLNNAPFYHVGYNAYWIADPYFRGSTNSEVERAMALAQSQGFTVIRTWAFLDGVPRSPGVYDQRSLERMDFVLATANKYDLKISPDFGNYWPDYKPPEQYVEWALGSARGRDINDFYTNAAVKALFKDHISFIINRRNSISGTRYGDDPAIFSWGILNEPRCPGCNEQQKSGVLSWVREMAQLVKSLAPYHLVNVGTEGFFDPANVLTGQNLALVGYNPGVGAQCEGVDWLALNEIPEVDIASLHIYPKQVENLPNPDPNNFSWVTCDWVCLMNWLQQWVAIHEEVAARMFGKPLIIQETAINSATYSPAERKQWMQLLVEMLITSKAQGNAFAGMQWWTAKLDGMTDYDGYSIYVDNPTRGNRRLLQALPELESPGPEEEGLEVQFTEAAAVVDAAGFRRSSSRSTCAQAAADAGWRPIFRRSGLVDLGKLTETSAGQSSLGVLIAGARAVAQ